MNPSPRSRPVRLVLVGVGVVCVGIGLVGIVVPVLPTTPFLLLAAASFVRSSPRMHEWLLTHPRLGPYVSFVDGGGMPVKARRNALVVLWIAIAASSVLMVLSDASVTIRVGVVSTLLVVALLVTRFLVRLPTRDGDAGG